MQCARRREARTSIILVSFIIIYCDWNLEVGTLGFVELYAVNSVVSYKDPEYNAKLRGRVVAFPFPTTGPGCLFLTVVIDIIIIIIINLGLNKKMVELG